MCRTASPPNAQHAATMAALSDAMVEAALDASFNSNSDVEIDEDVR